MSDYISRQQLINSLKERYKLYGDSREQAEIGRIIHVIEKFPADIVEVVRCKDCAHSATGACRVCRKLVMVVKDEHYCSYAERKES